MVRARGPITSEHELGGAYAGPGSPRQPWADLRAVRDQPSYQWEIPWRPLMAPAWRGLCSHCDGQPPGAVL